MPWVLKGGYALELRFKAARSTVDIDLTIENISGVVMQENDVNQVVREMLQAAASLDLGDWFEYTIGPVMMDIATAPYGGARYPVEARMDGRAFARFHLDAGVGDMVIHPLETVETRDWLGFAGIESPQVPLIPREQQFAEKVHAYSLPRNQPNSRVKDLADMALLIGDTPLDRHRLLEALRLTFERRKTHPLPNLLEAPPSQWAVPFESLAKDCGLEPNILAVFERVAVFYRNVIADA